MINSCRPVCNRLAMMLWRCFVLALSTTRSIHRVIPILLLTNPWHQHLQAFAIKTWSPCPSLHGRWMMAFGFFLRYKFPIKWKFSFTFRKTNLWLFCFAGWAAKFCSWQQCHSRNISDPTKHELIWWHHSRCDFFFLQANMVTSSESPTSRIIPGFNLTQWLQWRPCKSVSKCSDGYAYQCSERLHTTSKYWRWKHSSCWKPSVKIQF